MQMEDIAHPDDGSRIEIAGYRSCANEWCSELILKEIATRTRGFCPPCFSEVTGPSITEIEIRNRGQRMTTPVRMKNRPSKNKGSRLTSKRAHKANVRAMRRLAMMFPDLYDILRAEERSRDGLDPWPVETVVTTNDGPDVDESVDFARLLAALDEAGVDVPE
jgi:hypothetical protein